MKVLLVNNFFGPLGGSENSTKKTGQVLADNGHEVFFFATDRKPYFDEDYKYQKFFPSYIKFSDLKWRDLPKFLLNPSYFYNFEAERKLDLYLKEIKPDIVHLNCITYYLSPSVIASCQKNNIPVVLTIRDPFLFCPNVGLMINSETFCEQELCVSGNPIHCVLNRCNDKSIFKSVVSSIEFSLRKIHGLYNKIPVFICTSEAILNLALKSGIPNEKLILINNFLDDSILQIRPEFTNKGYFLFAGRLEKEKGINILLKAMSKLPDVQLRIVGTGSDEENLKKMTRDMNLTNVTFAGYKIGEDLAQEYRGCIATIIPSNYFEAFGMTILESFAYGKPVIGSNIGGIPELIDDNINGFTFELENVNQLTLAMNKMNSDKLMARKMGRNGRVKAETQYHSKVYYSKLISLYKSVAGMEEKNENFARK